MVERLRSGVSRNPARRRTKPWGRGGPRGREIDRAPSRPRTRSAHTKGQATEAEAGTQARSHRSAFAIVLPMTPNSRAIE